MSCVVCGRLGGTARELRYARAANLLDRAEAAGATFAALRTGYTLHGECADALKRWLEARGADDGKTH